MTQTTAIVFDQTAKHSQGYDRTRISRVPLDGGGAWKLLRTTIHLDTSYHAQSRAKVEVWTDRWVEIHSSPGEALPWAAAPARIEPTGLLAQIVEQFEEIAREVLS